MAFRWQVTPDLPAAEQAVLGLDGDFPDQAAAESWLAAFYLDLADAGVSAVTLTEGGRTVYGPMSLEA